MTKDIALVDPVRTDDAKELEKKPHVDDGKPLEDEDTKDMSEEDIQLRDELNMLVMRLKEPNAQLHHPSLQILITLIRTSTSSMTSVPKPLKFLRPHFDSLKSIYQSWTDKSNKALLADILSVLAMSFVEDGKRETLSFCLAGTPGGKCSWGHEYVRYVFSLRP